MTSLLAQQLPAEPPPGVSYAAWAASVGFITLLGGGGVFGVWLQARSARQQARDAQQMQNEAEGGREGAVTLRELLAKYTDVLTDLSDLKANVTSLQAQVSELRDRELKLTAAYRALARLSLNEINRLRTLLKLNAIERWPPSVEPDRAPARGLRPQSPNSPPPPPPPAPPGA